MKAARQRDTAPERALRSALHRCGLRFRLHRRIIPGVRREVDICFGPAKVAVFVDGCFWHSCPEHGTQPQANSSFWREKLEANVRRDHDTDRRIRDLGWLPVRVWEHEDVSTAARRVARLVKRRVG